MTRKALALFAALCLPAPALAEMPVFAADCPLGNRIDADRNGNVRVNGGLVPVEKFNDQYYEARMESVTFSISHEGGGAGLIVSYTAPGGANGMCTVTASAGGGSGNAADDGGGAMAGAPAQGSATATVTGVAANDLLNVRSGPGTANPVVGQLANGDRVRNLGCRSVGQARWCEIEMMTDMRERGWVNARFLAGASAGSGGGASSGAVQAPAPSGTPAFWQVRVTSALNVHSAPSTGSPTFFQLPNGSVVRNLGCQRAEGRTWCQVPTGPTDGASIGWVAAEFLTPGAAPANGANAAIPAAAPNRPPAAGTGETTTVRVRFAAGTTGAEYRDQLMPGASKRYVLGASNGQDLYVRLAANGPNMFYQIFNPDGSFLLDQMRSDREYRGQLWQSGDHVIEVINRGNGAQSYTVIFGIE